MKAGIYVTDITPPLEAGLLTSSVNQTCTSFKKIRLPLKARVLVLEDSAGKFVLVSLDLLGLSDSSVKGWKRFKKAIAEGINPGRIIITCTHTHNSPESVGLTNLVNTIVFEQWLRDLEVKLRFAIRYACKSLRPCTMTFGTALLEGFSLQRRIATDHGIIMSDAVQPVAAELFDRTPVDRRVKAICFRALNGNGIATIVHAVCHPVYEMCLPQISSDFPGEMCNALERTAAFGVPMFLNGAAGDINPPGVSLGQKFAEQHGRALVGLIQQLDFVSATTGSFKYANSEFELPVRSEAGISNASDAIARINVIAIGEIAFVFLPGEPFIKIALEIERNSPFETTIVTGYSENSIGYIPTSKAFEEGGYEVGPGKWSYLEKEAGISLYREAVKLVNALHTSVHRKQMISEVK